MSDEQTSHLHLRGFISLLTALSFLIMTVSGVILFITPQGRVAYWLDWTFMGISKGQWGDMHITTSLLFAVAGLWHTWLNWKALLSYFRDKVNKALALKKELAIAALITIFCTVGGIYKTPPLSYVLDFNEYFKESWIKTPEDEPVINHAELLPLKNFLQKVNIELEPALAELQRQGIQVTGPEQKLLDIARINRTSPSAIYKLLKQAAAPKKSEMPLPPTVAPSSEKQQKQQVLSYKPAEAPKRLQPVTWTAEQVQQEFEGKGVGRRTLADICQEYRLDQDAVVRKLAAKNIAMTSKDTLKKVSEERGELPIEILKIMLVGEKK